MKKINTATELETGLSALDLVNQTLLGLINRVIVASEAKNVAGLKSSLRDLQTETAVHFEREERLMAEINYAAADQHRAEHQQLSTEIQNQINELDAGTGNVSFTARLMRHWVLPHIVSKDSLFGRALLKQNGMSERRQVVDMLLPGKGAYVFEERRLENLDPIVWDLKMAVGIELLDTDHRVMVTILGAIHDAGKSADSKKLAALLEQLGNETEAHFKHEETLMSRIDYEHVAVHKEEHRKFLEEFALQVDDCQQSNIAAKLIGRFMYRWLLHHIAAFDMPLCEAINRENLRMSDT